MSDTQAGYTPSDYTPSSSDRFLWWLATAEVELIHDCVVDRNRYRIVGLSVLATWLFATLAWAYFFSTAIDNAWVYIPLGLFMGFIILTIDRTLIKGINRSNKNKITPLLFRGLLAITIGTFMAQPAILYLFDKEIQMQASLDNEGRKMEKRHELDSLYSGQKMATENMRNNLQLQLAAKEAKVDSARKSFIAETDGTGGSGKIGISIIALAKKAEYDKLQQEYSQLASSLQPQIDSLGNQLTAIELNIKNEEGKFAALLNNGFLTRIEALQNLIKSNDALANRYYLVLLILVLIELMPVIAKTILPAGTYDEKVSRREEMERTLVRHNTDREIALKDHFNESALQADKEAIDTFFEISRRHRNEKMEGLAEDWNKNKYQSFDGLWRKMKRDILTRWEN